MKRIITGICLLLGLYSANVPADEQVLQALWSIQPSIYHRLDPESLGRPLHLVVKLPPGYEENPEHRYPVIYVLDGGRAFPVLSGYYDHLVFQETVPEAILVALSYGARDFANGNYRSTDYTAPSDERDYWGGAGVFQQVLKQDVFPLIESHYRADPQRRVLFGQSLGGQFVLFSALSEPDLFWGRIASNPALHRNLDFFLQPHSDQKAGTSRLFVASGSDDAELFRGPAVAWIDHWNAEDDLPWTLRAITIDGYGHFSLITESFRQGMEWLFE